MHNCRATKREISGLPVVKVATPQALSFSRGGAGVADIDSFTTVNQAVIWISLPTALTYRVWIDLTCEWFQSKGSMDLRNFQSRLSTIGDISNLGSDPVPESDMVIVGGRQWTSLIVNCPE
jgi:hypothetical protein